MMPRQVSGFGWLGLPYLSGVPATQSLSYASQHFGPESNWHSSQLSFLWFGSHRAYFTILLDMITWWKSHDVTANYWFLLLIPSVEQQDIKENLIKLMGVYFKPTAYIAKKGIQSFCWLCWDWLTVDFQVSLSQSVLCKATPAIWKI